MAKGSRLVTAHREEGKKMNTNTYVNKLEGPSCKTLEIIKINLIVRTKKRNGMGTKEVFFS